MECRLPRFLPIELKLANFTAAGITMDGYILPGEWEMKVSVVYESRNKFYQHLIVRL